MTTPKLLAMAEHAKTSKAPAALAIVGPRKVRVSKAGVAAFNRCWPCSTLRATRAYWFEFEANGGLVDTDVPEQDDGSAAVAMSQDCQAFLFDGKQPTWAP